LGVGIVGSVIPKDPMVNVGVFVGVTDTFGVTERFGVGIFEIAGAAVAPPGGTIAGVEVSTHSRHANDPDPCDVPVHDHPGGHEIPIAQIFVVFDWESVATAFGVITVGVLPCCIVIVEPGGGFTQELWTHLYPPAHVPVAVPKLQEKLSGTHVPIQLIGFDVITGIHLQHTRPGSHDPPSDTLI
jgi:hypothetical protein